MFKNLTDIWGIVVQPTKTIEKVIKTKTLVSALFVLIIFVAFHFISKVILSQIFYTFSPLKGESLFTFSFINFLIALSYWFLFFSIIHGISKFFKAKGSYINLLKTGAYISVIGLPFTISYTLRTHITDANTIINYVFETVFGLFSPCLQLINHLGVFLNRWGDVAAPLGPQISLLAYIWVLAVVVLAIKEVHQISLKRAIASFAISFIIFSMLANILESVVIEPLVRNVLNLQ